MALAYLVIKTMSLKYSEDIIIVAAIYNKRIDIKHNLIALILIEFFEVYHKIDIPTIKVEILTKQLRQ